MLENDQKSRSPIDALDLDSKGYPTGSEGIVWATYNLQQAEIISNALLTQHILCEIKETTSNTRKIHLLLVTDAGGTEDAMDFIWREKSGLRLKPDWHYAEGAINESFERWLSGI